MRHEKTVSESRIWTPLGALGRGWNRKKSISIFIYISTTMIKGTLKQFFSQPHSPKHAWFDTFYSISFQSSFGLSISSSATVAKSYTEANCKTDFLVVNLVCLLSKIMRLRTTKLSKVRNETEQKIVNSNAKQVRRNFDLLLFFQAMLSENFQNGYLDTIFFTWSNNQFQNYENWKFGFVVSELVGE